MKTLKVLFVCLALVGLNSCYVSRIAYGIDYQFANDEIVTYHNHIILYGLVPLTEQHRFDTIRKEYPAYVVTTKTSFVDGLLGMISCGLYTPTTTIVRIPGEKKVSTKGFTWK